MSSRWWCLSGEHYLPSNQTSLCSRHPRSDEIYGVSVFREGGPPFVSAEQMAVREAAALPGGENAAQLVGGGRAVKGMGLDWAMPVAARWRLRWPSALLFINPVFHLLRNSRPQPTHHATNHLNPPRQVHVIFGMSKDFCASGLRLGCLHSRNAALNKAMVNLTYFTLPSSIVQVGDSSDPGLTQCHSRSCCCPTN